MWTPWKSRDTAAFHRPTDTGDVFAFVDHATADGSAWDATWNEIEATDVDSSSADVTGE